MLRHSSLTGGSFIQDHQQYRSSPAPPDHILHEQSIDNILSRSQDRSQDDLAHSASTLSISNGRAHAISPTPSQIADSGVIHSLSHSSCQPLPDDGARIVATLFYKAQAPRHPKFHPDTLAAAGRKTNLPPPTVAEGAAPTQDFGAYTPPPPA